MSIPSTDLEAQRILESGLGSLVFRRAVNGDGNLEGSYDRFVQHKPYEGQSIIDLRGRGADVRAVVLNMFEKAAKASRTGSISIAGQFSFTNVRLNTDLNEFVAA